MTFRTMKFILPLPKICLLLGLITVMHPASAADPVLPAEVDATVQILRTERDSLWEKTLVVRFPERRRVLSTSDGMVDAVAAINHAAHPDLWHLMGSNSKDYTAEVRNKVADGLHTRPSNVTQMSTAADMDNLAVVTLQHGPLTVTALATAGAKSNAIRTGIDVGSYIEDEAPAGTINIMLLSNVELSDAALARALITITEGKTAALEDLRVPSTYTKDVQATGTGTDSIIVVSGTRPPRATYTGGHSKIGELIGKAAYRAVIEALGKQNGFYLPGTLRFADESAGAPKPAGSIRLALLHFDPVPGDIAGNRSRIEDGIREAVRQGADWVITPELAETGYYFEKRIGTSWIEPFPGAWISRLTGIARDNKVALFIGYAERDLDANKLFNSVAVIDRNGSILGSYRKQRVHGGAEAWSQAGSEEKVFEVDGVPVGTLICADTNPPEPAARLAAKGAAIVLAPANWPPVGGMGPGDVWERRSRENGIPLVVVNRGGVEPELDFSLAETVVVSSGERQFGASAPEGGLFLLDWDRKQTFRRVGAK